MRYSDRGNFFSLPNEIFLFTGGEKKSRKKPNTTSPRSAEGPLGRHQQQVGEGDFTHPSGGASRAFGLPQAAPNSFLRAGARTHFPACGPKGRRKKGVRPLKSCAGVNKKAIIVSAEKVGSASMPSLVL